MNDLEAAEILSRYDPDRFYGEELYTALAHAAKVLRERAAAEPVAWRGHSTSESPMYLYISQPPREEAKLTRDWVPLYTAPPSTEVEK